MNYHWKASNYLTNRVCNYGAYVRTDASGMSVMEPLETPAAWVYLYKIDADTGELLRYTLDEMGRAIWKAL